ncbi:MAG: M23 family metallopeptidase [Prevotellaceae bacterium]|jgi:murein DD-endopeptidase MepM/ murein hydrolase activator NlpD|nr:M23 family metallopeptidase [Prevotellaceae bacterium]
MPRKKTSQYMHKLQSKYRLIIYNDTTFAEVWHTRLSRLNVFTFFSSITLVVVAVVVLLIAFTPLRELIPGYPDSKTRRYIVQNARRLDSLEQKVRHWALYNDNLSRILSGEEPLNIEEMPDTTLELRYEAVMRSYFVEDSLFRRQVEEIELQQLTAPSSGSASLHFYPPVRGRVTSAFDPHRKRYGVGVETVAGGAVMAALDGVIVAASWTVENGYVINIQHTLNITTVYKNSKRLFKQVGEQVTAGEIIATSDAGLLLFEIWNSGTAVDPEQYIVF